MPLVSVVIPAYQVTAYVAEAIDSVLAQTLTDFEIVLVNDGCPDTTNLEFVLAPYRKDPRFRYIVQENRGVAEARNRGILESSSPFVAVLDGDDVWSPDYLSTLHGLLSPSPDIVLAFSNEIFFGQTALVGQTMMDYYPAHGDFISFLDLVTRRSYATAHSMFRKSAAEKIGYYDSSLRSAEDYDFNLRMTRIGRVTYTKEPLLYYRMRPQSLTKSYLIGQWRIRVLEKHVHSPGLSPSELEALETELVWNKAIFDFYAGRAALVAGETKEAITLIERANLVRKSGRVRWILWLMRVLPAPMRWLAKWRDRSRPH